MIGTIAIALIAVLLGVGLGYFFQLNIAWGEVMAYLSVITVPILVLFLSLQRVFVESIASSGIKG